MDQHRRTFTEAQLRSILGLAARHDVAKYSVQDIRAVGRELDISDEAVDYAITSLRGREVEEPVVNNVTRLAAWCAAAGVVTGAATAVSLAGLQGSEGSLVGALCLPLLVLGAGMVTRSSSGRGKLIGLLEFQRKNFMLWGGYAVGWGILALGPNNAWYNRFGREQLISTVLLWVLTAAFGGVAALVRTPSVDDTAGGSPAPWRFRLAERLKNYVDRMLVRMSAYDLRRPAGRTT